jgi:nucleoside-diphosphate-sugar epimerase
MLTRKSVIAITGSSGILGTLLRQHLQSLNYKVIGIDKIEPTTQGAPLLNIQVNTDSIDRVCDFSDEKSCENIFEDCTHVVHLAAVGDAAAPMNEEILPNNIVGMINACHAAKASKTVSKFVFASTNHTFHGNTMGKQGPGSFSVAKMLEQGGPGNVTTLQPFAPDSNYAVSKIFGESLGSYMGQIEGAFDFVALRIGWCAYDSPMALEGTFHDEYLKAMFLSKRDFVGYAVSALNLDLSPHNGFLAAFAVSANETCPFDITESSQLLGYTPKDGHTILPSQ